MIKMRNIPLFKVFMPESVMEPLQKTLLSGYIGQGRQVDEFEELLKQRLNYPYLITLNNCTSGLTMALRMAGVEPDTEVISTPLTCSATNLPILANFAKIKWADVDPTTCNIDINDVVAKINSKTKAILFVHWGGYPVDVDRLRMLLKLNGWEHIPIIEDCAHSFGSLYKGRPVGTSGNWAAFSFQAIKTLTTVDGGLLCVPDKFQYNRAKLLRWYGIDRTEPNRSDFRAELDISEWGYKYHMNDIAAVIGIEQLKYTDQILATTKDNAAYFNDQLASIPGITLLQDAYNPDSTTQSSYWLYTIKVASRANFIRYMKEKGITCSRVHERNDIHTCMRQFICHLPQLDKLTQETCCIPVGWWVNKEDREYIVNCIKEGW